VTSTTTFGATTVSLTGTLVAATADVETAIVSDKVQYGGYYLPLILLTPTFTTIDSDNVKVEIQLARPDLTAMTQRIMVHWYLSTATPSSMVAGAIDSVIGGTYGDVLEIVAGRYGVANTDADGKITFQFQYTGGATTRYLNIGMPLGNIYHIGTAITFS
jgi:hypothetical protein